MSSGNGLTEGAKLGGWFDIGNGRSVLGELSIRGTNTSLYLHDAEFFHLGDERVRRIAGLLHDRTKVTLFDSHVRSAFGSATRHGESYWFAELMPQYVVWGDRHLPGDGPAIARMTFHVDDAESLFFDFDVMRHVLDPQSVIDLVVAADERDIGRRIPTGPFPDIAYFTGRTELANVQTAVGTVRVYHQPSQSHPLAVREVGMRNRTLVDISFAEPRFLEDALDAALCVLRFLVMLAGRPQTIDAFAVDTVGEPGQPLELYWAHVPIRPAQWEERSPHPAEILIPVADEPEQFATVLRNWLAVDLERRVARVRFAIGFENQRSFSVDRLVGAANMYDILPESAFGVAGPLAEDVAKAKAVARDAFRELPPSPERASILSALGRLGRPTLRSKIAHRAEIVSGSLPTPLTDLDLVVDEAVRCRNHYVHGSTDGLDYVAHADLMTFLTSVLEFLFAASDLIDAGWNIAGWRSRGSVLAHPFNQVLHMWDAQVARIKELRAAAAT